MELIRLLNIRHYDPYRGRFTSEAFRAFGQGISVIDEECVRASGRTVCEHIEAFYASTAGDPPIHWTFSSELLPPSAALVQEPSTTGDQCHHDIRGLNKTEQRSFFKRFWDKFDLFRLCRADGTDAPLTREALDQQASGSQ